MIVARFRAPPTRRIRSRPINMNRNLYQSSVVTPTTPPKVITIADNEYDGGRLRRKRVTRNKRRHGRKSRKHGRKSRRH